MKLMKLTLSDKQLNLFYWPIILGLWLAQGWYSLASTNQIRFEELSESVRNVFWLQNGAIYDGLSSNIGWYSILLAVYNLFGFHLHTAKIIRLGLHLISLLSLSSLLKKYLGVKKAWLPLIAIGLSPTLLFFNLLQGGFGFDLQYFPICLWLVATLDFSKPRSAILKQVGLWSLSMLASTSYPAFIFYLPVLGLIYLSKLIKAQKGKSAYFVIKHILISSLSFFTPLLIGLSLLKDNSISILFNDPQTNNSGIFRGGGTMTSPQTFPQLFSTINNGIKVTFHDLFNSAQSYYYEPVRVEFSHLATAAALGLVLLFSLLLFKNKKWLWPALFGWLLIVLGLIGGSFSGWFPGIRRTTPALAGFYILFAGVWGLSFQFKNKVKTILSLIGMGSCLIIFLHHVKVFPNNLAGLAHPSRHNEGACFSIVPHSPSQSLAVLVSRIQQDPRLIMEDLNGSPIDCRLHEIYAAVAGSCYWNKSDCPQILGFDGITQTYIPLKIELWETYYFSH